MVEFNPVNPIRISYFKCPRTHQVDPFTIRPGSEVVELVTNGVVYFQSRRKTLKLGCGALFWHRPGEETIHRTEPDAPYECLAIHFSMGGLDKRPAPRLTIIADMQRALELSRELLHAFHDTAVDRHELANYAYSRFLWEAHLGAIRHTAQVRPAAIAAVLYHLESHFRQQEVGVRELARAGNISEPHLHMLFRRYLDETPYQALLSRRLHEAKLLLSGTSESIKSLPAQCGFAGIETFYRAFKRHIGMTPLAYRQRHRAERATYERIP